MGALEQRRTIIIAVALAALLALRQAMCTEKVTAEQISVIAPLQPQK
jgi:hypothetical protein